MSIISTYFFYVVVNRLQHYRSPTGIGASSPPIPHLH